MLLVTMFAYNGNATLEFHSYHFGDPKYTVEECHDRGMTYAIRPAAKIGGRISDLRLAGKPLVRELINVARQPPMT